MQANTFFNALLRPAEIPMRLKERAIREEVPPHRQVSAKKVLKSQDTMHRASVWREENPKWYADVMERRWRKELVARH